MAEFTLNEGLNPKGQAKLILKSYALQNIKPSFYRKNDNEDEEKARDEGDLNKHLSRFGLPVFDVLSFDTLQYTALDGKKVKIENIDLATVLIEVSQSKNIVTTAIQGRNGTVKEYISDGDYMINIKGVLVGDGIDVRPTGKINVLNAFCSAPVEFNVASNILADFGIYTIVVKDYNFGQMEANRNVVPFEINAYSETPFEIKAQTQNEDAGKTRTAPRFI